MAQIDWNAELETGFSDIDNQHQQIVLHINELHKIRNSSDPMLIAQALFDLISCAMNHFAYEEEMLESAAYKLTEVRRNTHANFTNRLLDFQNRILSGETVTEELLEYLNTWIDRHIRISDQGYIETVQQSGLYEQNGNGGWQRINSETEQQDMPFEQTELPSEQAEAQSVPTDSNPVFTAIENEQPETANQQQEKQASEQNKKPRSWAGTY